MTIKMDGGDVIALIVMMALIVSVVLCIGLQRADSAGRSDAARLARHHDDTPLAPHVIATPAVAPASQSFMSGGTVARQHLCAVVTYYYRDGHRVCVHSVCPDSADASLRAHPEAGLTAITNTTHWVS